jgi:GNAT superfamily N-acetyltransferase
MQYKFVEYNEPEIKSEICKSILENLPFWFGVPESNEEYIRNVRKHRFISVLYNNCNIGFVSIKVNSEKVNELYVLGLLKNQHRKGIGSELLKFVEDDLIKNGVEYLEVKTLDESHESEEYKKTRLFYFKNGFIKFDVLLNEWGENNPCLIMLKRLKKT